MKEMCAFADIENKDAYFVVNAKGPTSALMCLESYFPETKGIFLPKNGREVYFSKCLDCESFWINEDGMCGECLEQRLSKRAKLAYYFEKE